MGARGPVPTRSDQRRRRNKPEDGVEVASAPGSPDFEPPATPDDWHPVAQRLFDSLKESGQRAFYEPSDWAVAYLMCESLSLDLQPQFVGFAQTGRDQTEAEYAVIPLKGASLSAYLKGLASLLVTEGDRRRVRIELTRGVAVDEDEEASVTALAGYRANLTA